jgi:hypothetical protein
MTSLTATLEAALGTLGGLDVMETLWTRQLREDFFFEEISEIKTMLTAYCGQGYRQ